MSITYELRDFIAEQQWCAKGTLSAIADRIDAEAEDNERFRHEAEPFCDRLREAAAERADVTLFGVDYVALPLDADGVPIRVGDVMEVKFDTKRRPFTVSFVGERAVAFWVVGQPDLKSFNLDTVLVTHHHEPTVEDVLREFAANIADVLGGDDFKLDDNDELYAEYAAKLRLAGDGE